MPQYATLSTAECNAIHIAREYAPDAARKAMKREIFARAKVAFGIPATHKLVVETDVQATNAGLLKNKDTRETYELNDHGKWKNGTTGVDAQRWFKVSADKLQDAMIDVLDNMDAEDEAIVSQADKPANAAAHPSNPKLLLSTDGSIWVQLDADAYDEPTNTPDEEEEDDPAY